MSDRNNGTAASLGSWVKVKDDLFDEEEVFRIADTTDPDRNYIASDSDLGRALIGSRPGDEVAVEGPRGTVKFSVLDVDVD